MQGLFRPAAVVLAAALAVLISVATRTMQKRAEMTSAVTAIQRLETLAEKTSAINELIGRTGPLETQEHSRTRMDS